MKKVKKLLAMALATVMVAASLVGCGGNSSNGGENAGGETGDTEKSEYSYTNLTILIFLLFVKHYKIYKQKMMARLNLNSLMEKVTGAIAALQAQGFNTDDGDKSIVVVGVDATTAAQEYIAKGYMLGSVLQDAEGMAKALYETGLNLAEGKEATEGTTYEFDDSGIAIRIPYQPYLK